MTLLQDHNAKLPTRDVLDSSAGSQAVRTPLPIACLDYDMGGKGNQDDAR